MKYIGLDLGSVTCGVSKSETGRIAQPVKTIRFHPDDYDEAIDKILEYLKEESVNYTVSFNGKARYNKEFPIDADNDTIQKEVIADEHSEKWMEGKQIVKVIIVPKKLINIVLK